MIPLTRKGEQNMERARNTQQIDGGLPGWLTIKEAGHYASVDPRTIRVWLKEGLNCSRRNRKTVRIRPVDIDEFLFQDYSNKHPDIADLNVKAIVSKITSHKANQHSNPTERSS